MHPLALSAAENHLVEQVFVLLRVRRELTLFFPALTVVVGLEVLDQKVVLESVQRRLARDTSSVVGSALLVMPVVDLLLDREDVSRVPVVFIGDVADVVKFLFFRLAIAF